MINRVLVTVTVIVLAAIVLALVGAWAKLAEGHAMDHEDER